MAHGPMSQLAWWAGLSFGLQSVSLGEEQATDLDLIPTPQVAEHCNPKKFIGHPVRLSDFEADFYNTLGNG